MWKPTDRHSEPRNGEADEGYEAGRVPRALIGWAIAIILLLALLFLAWQASKGDLNRRGPTIDSDGSTGSPPRLLADEGAPLGLHLRHAAFEDLGGDEGHSAEPFA